MEGRCPYCGAEVVIRGETVACHQCHEVFQTSEAARLPQSSTLEYFGEGSAKKREGTAFASREVTAAVISVTVAVALGMWMGLMEPEPILRRGGACGVFVLGAVGAAVALVALVKRRLGHVDKSLALTAVGLGVLCMAAGVVIFMGWRA